MKCITGHLAHAPPHRRFEQFLHTPPATPSSGSLRRSSPPSWRSGPFMPSAPRVGRSGGLWGRVSIERALPKSPAAHTRTTRSRSVRSRVGFFLYVFNLFNVHHSRTPTGRGSISLINLARDEQVPSGLTRAPFVFRRSRRRGVREPARHFAGDWRFRLTRRSLFTKRRDGVLSIHPSHLGAG